MRKLATILTILGLSLVSASAFAQNKKDKAAKVKSYDFSGDTIEGDLVAPEGVGVTAEGVTQFSSLIRIRRDFIAEIVKAAEDL